jgi:arsenate reductase-like glutaredoxin family protein
MPRKEELDSQLHELGTGFRSLVQQAGEEYSVSGILR